MYRGLLQPLQAADKFGRCSPTHDFSYLDSPVTILEDYYVAVSVVERR